MSIKNTQIVPFKEKVSTVRKMFADRQKQMLATLPKTVTPERLVVLAMAAIQNTPKLMECDQLSFVSAVIQSGRLGLEPDGLLGQAYLVPFKKKVVLIPGYKGLLKLARNSGQISTIQAHEVYSKDKFDFHYGLDPKLEHVPTQESDPGKIVAFYAIGKLKDGSVQFDVMWRNQVDKIRDSSQGYKAAKQYNSDTPWETHYAEMGKKTVLRRLCKMLPASVDLQRAVSLDEEADAGIEQNFDIIDVEPETVDGNGSNGSSEQKSSLDSIVDAEDARKAAEQPSKTVTKKQIDNMWKVAREKGFTDAEIDKTIREQGYDNQAEIPASEYDRIISIFENAQ